MRNIKDNDKALLEGLVSKYGKNNVLSKVNSLNENVDPELIEYFNDNIKDVIVHTNSYEEAKNYYQDAISNYRFSFSYNRWPDNWFNIFKRRMEKALSTYDSYKKYVRKYKDEIEQNMYDEEKRRYRKQEDDIDAGRRYFNAQKLIDPILKSGSKIKFNGKPVKLSIDNNGDINVTF